MQLLSVNKTENLKTWLEELREFQLDSLFDTTILGRAFLYVDSVNPIVKEDFEIQSEITGTSSYTITLKSVEGNILGSCTCPFEGKCKHLAASILYFMDNYN